MALVSTVPEEDQHKTTSSLVRGAVAMLACALAIYTATALTMGLPKTVALLPAAVLFGAGLAGLALLRFEAFILVVLAIRTSLDAVKINAGPLGDPAAIVGLLLLATVPMWLLLQHRSGAIRFRLTTTGLVVLAFTGAALLGVVISEEPVTSAVEWSRIAAAAAAFFAIEQIAINRPSFRWQTVAAAFLAVPIPVATAFYQVSSGEGLFEAAGFERVVGTFAHSNPFAAFLAFVMVMAFASAVVLNGSRRRWSLLVVAIAAPALLLTYTRGAWIAVVLGVLVVALVLRKLLIAGILVASVLALALFMPSVTDRFSDLSSVSDPTQTTSSLSWRFEYWEESLAISQASPIVGVGLKQIASNLPEHKQPHNDYLRAYVELGVIGLVAFVGLLIQFMLIGPRAAAALRRRGASGVDLAIAAGFSGAAVGLASLSLVANLMSQTVVLTYVMAFAALTSAILVESRQPSEAVESIREPV